MSWRRLRLRKLSNYVPDLWRDRPGRSMVNQFSHHQAHLKQELSPASKTFQNANVLFTNQYSLRPSTTKLHRYENQELFLMIRAFLQPYSSDQIVFYRCKHKWYSLRFLEGWVLYSHYRRYKQSSNRYCPMG